jgi:uncharacterized protein YceK
MRLVILPIIVSLLAGCGTTPKAYLTTPTTKAAVAAPEVISDPIDRLVARLSPPPPPPPQIDYDHPRIVNGITIYDYKPYAITSTGGWGGGTFSIIDLPATASAEEVAVEVMRRWEFSSYKILKIRQVYIPSRYGDTGPPTTTAVLVSTNAGEKIALFFYSGSVIKWSVRVYDVEPSA